MRPAKLLHFASLLRSSPLISAAFSFGRNDFKWNHRRHRHKRIIFFVKTFVASVQIEETKLSHAGLLRSKTGSFEFDLHAAWKSEFLEAP